MPIDLTRGVPTGLSLKPIALRERRWEIPDWSSLRLQRMQAERTIAAGEGMIELGRADLARVEALEQQRIALDKEGE